MNEPLKNEATLFTVNDLSLLPPHILVKLQLKTKYIFYFFLLFGEKNHVLADKNPTSRVNIRKRCSAYNANLERWQLTLT